MRQRRFAYAHLPITHLTDHVRLFPIAHHRAFWTQRHGVVWSLPLQAGSGRPHSHPWCSCVSVHGERLTRGTSSRQASRHSRVEVYLRAYSDGWEAEISLARLLWRYCHVRPHSSLRGRTPYEVYIETELRPSRPELTMTEG